jgi:hypothetical protein
MVYVRDYAEIARTLDALHRQILSRLPSCTTCVTFFRSGPFRYKKEPERARTVQA